VWNLEERLDFRLPRRSRRALRSSGILRSEYRGADKSLARPTLRCILFDGYNISFDASLVIYINSSNIPPIIIINRIYEHQNHLSLQLFTVLVGLRTYQHPCISNSLPTFQDNLLVQFFKGQANP